MVWFDLIGLDWIDCRGCVHVVFSLNCCFPHGLVGSKLFLSTWDLDGIQVEPPWSVEWSCWRMVPWIRQIDFVKILMKLRKTSAGLIKFLAMFFRQYVHLIRMIWAMGGSCWFKVTWWCGRKRIIDSGPATYLEWWEALQHPSWLLQSAEILENFCRICFRWKHQLIASELRAFFPAFHAEKKVSCCATKWTIRPQLSKPTLLGGIISVMMCICIFCCIFLTKRVPKFDIFLLTNQRHGVFQEDPCDIFKQVVSIHLSIHTWIWYAWICRTFHRLQLRQLFQIRLGCWVGDFTLKNGGWKTILSYWEGSFSGASC